MHKPTCRLSKHSNKVSYSTSKWYGKSLSHRLFRAVGKVARQGWGDLRAWEGVARGRVVLKVRVRLVPAPPRSVPAVVQAWPGSAPPTPTSYAVFSPAQHR